MHSSIHTAEMFVLPFGAALPQRQQELAQLSMSGLVDTTAMQPAGYENTVLPFGAEQFVPLRPLEAGSPPTDTGKQEVRNYSPTRLSNGQSIQDVTTHTLY